MPSTVCIRRTLAVGKNIQRRAAKNVARLVVRNTMKSALCQKSSIFIPVQTLRISFRCTTFSCRGLPIARPNVPGQTYLHEAVDTARRHETVMSWDASGVNHLRTPKLQNKKRFSSEGVNSTLPGKSDPHGHSLLTNRPESRRGSRGGHSQRAYLVPPTTTPSARACIEGAVRMGEMTRHVLCALNVQTDTGRLNSSCWK